MNIKFELRDHANGQGTQVVDVLADGRLLGTIYPHALGVHVVSKYLGSLVPTLNAPRGVLVTLEVP